MPKVTGLFIYPVKSLRRVELNSATVEPRGLAGDRRWLIIRPDGEFVTQRDQSVLATISARLVGTSLNLEAEGHGQAVVAQPEGAARPVVIWKDTVDAIDAGDMVGDWLTSVVGFEVRLVYMPDSTVRTCRPEFSHEGDHVSFADGFPLLLANESSLDDLNSRLEEPVPMARFRPNIVIEGFAPFAEDGWSRVLIGDAEFRFAKPCGRCIVTTTDQETGERKGPEPLTTLTSYRLVGQSANFGVNLIPDVLGTISVGDEVRVV